MRVRTRMVSYGPRFAAILRMRKLLTITLFALGCGGGPGMQPAPRPSPAEGGFQSQPAPVVRGWVPLGVPTQVTRMQQTLELGGAPGPITTLLVKGVSGEPEIDRIQVEYMDHTRKGVVLQKRFVPGDGQVVELESHRPIEKIIIFMDPDSEGTIEILGA